MSAADQVWRDLMGVFLFCVIVFIAAVVALSWQSFTSGPAATDMAEQRERDAWSTLCDEAIQTQQTVKRGPYEARPYGERCVVYQLVYSGGG